MFHPQKEKGPWRFRPTALLSDGTHKKNREALDEARHGLLVFSTAGSNSGRHTSSV